MQLYWPFSVGPPGKTVYLFDDLFPILDRVIPNLDSPHHPQTDFLWFGGRLFCIKAPPITRLGLLLSEEAELWGLLRGSWLQAPLKFLNPVLCH